MSYKLFIDDERHPTTDDFVVVRDYDQAVAYMAQNGCPTFISFDHDLGENPKTGYDVARWIVEKDLDCDGRWLSDFEFCVHSQNPIGKRNIEELLISYAYNKGKV